MRAASLPSSAFVGGALVVLLASCAMKGDPQQDLATLRTETSEAHDIAASLVNEVGPRFAGSEGDARAVQWALKTLKELGFQDVRAEPVPVPRWERGTILVEMRKPYARKLEAVALGGSVATPPSGVEGDIVVVRSVEELKQLPDAAVKGRIVYFSGRTERTKDGSGYGKAVLVRRNGPAAAGRKGAKAALIRSIGTDRHAHTGTTKYDDGPKIPAAALSAGDADRIEKAAARGRVRVRLAIGSRAGEGRSANVIGEVPGQTSEIVLLGAHLDSWDITPGANDDAAGVGIVIAAARRIAALGRKPHRTLRVVLYANEEFGINGAKGYAQAHAEELARHAVVMEADSGSGAPYRINANVAAADWPLVQKVAGQLLLEVGGNGKEGGTDVGELCKLGVPELIVAQDASAYFDVHHTAGDTIDTLNRTGLAQATAVFAVLAHAASERPEGFGRVQPLKPSP